MLIHVEIYIYIRIKKNDDSGGKRLKFEPSNKPIQ